MYFFVKMYWGRKIRIAGQTRDKTNTNTVRISINNADCWIMKTQKRIPKT